MDHSLAELDDGSYQLADILKKGYPNAPEDDSGFHIAVDIQDNELDLELAPDYPMTPDLRGMIFDFTPPVDIQPADAWVRMAEVDCPDRYNCSPDLRGGIFVQGQNSPYEKCTLGYTMERSAVRYVTTAGHCNSEPWDHDSRIGPTLFTIDSGDLDFKVIDINNRSYWDAKAWVFRPADHSVPVALQINDPGPSLEGNVLCLSGVHGQKCGALVDWSYNDGDNSQQGRFDASACFGDSGAPVFNTYTDRAYGMVVSATDPANCGVRDTPILHGSRTWSQLRCLISLSRTE